MKRTEIKKLYENIIENGSKVTVCGWIKSIRVSKNLAFLSISDGSCFKPLQIIAESDKLAEFNEISKLNTVNLFLLRQQNSRLKSMLIKSQLKAHQLLTILCRKKLIVLNICVQYLIFVCAQILFRLHSR